MKRKSFTVSELEETAVREDYGIRKLTLRECLDFQRTFLLSAKAIDATLSWETFLQCDIFNK